MAAFRAAVQIAAELQRTLTLERRQVGDKTRIGEQHRIPVRLEIGIATAAPFIEFVFVAVEQLQLWIAIQLERGEIECRGGQLIIMIEQRDEFPGRHLKGIV